MEMRLSPAGSYVTGFWLVLIGALLGGGLFWIRHAFGVGFWLLWALFCLYFLLVYCPSVVIQADREELRVRAGRLFPTLKRIPLRSLCGLTRYSSPLLRAVGCCALLLYASSGLLCFLPALRLPDAEALAGLMREG